MTSEDDKVKAYMAAHPELVEQIAKKHGVEVIEEEGLDEGYLEQTVEEEEEVPEKPRRFGHGSNAEPDNDTTR